MSDILLARKKTLKTEIKLPHENKIYYQQPKICLDTKLSHHF